MKIYDLLADIQATLKAPKSQFNGFGKYSYRSCEDILEAAKPLLKNLEAVLTLSDEVVSIGGKNYIKATAELSSKDGDKVAVCGYARESDTKKGMDDSQITGSASSYARKYALNGLFLIDDTKDADTDEHKNQRENKIKSETKTQQNDKPTPIACPSCKKQVKDYTRDGKRYSAKQIAERNRQKYGEPICADCAVIRAHAD